MPGAQAQRGRVGIDHEAVGQQRVFAQDALEHVQRLFGVDGLEQLEDDRARLHGLVAQAVEHILHGASQPGPRRGAGPGNGP